MKEKILYVLNYVTNSGPSNVVRNLIHNLNKEQYEITLLTLFPGNDESVIGELKVQGVKVITCTSMTRMGCILGRDKEFRHYISQGMYDVIHTHGFIADILSSRLKNVGKRVSTVHNNMFEDYLLTYGKLKSKVYIPMHIHALRKIDFPVCCSKSSYDALRNQIPGLTYIRNGIAEQKPQRIVTRDELDIPSDATVFIYVGVLNSRKRIEWLVMQFCRAHNDKEYLLVLGDGEKRAACQAVADDHVRVLGFQSDPTAYMRISDIYVSASSSEGFSIAVLEALDAGLGLFLSDIPSHKEIFAINQGVYLGETFTSTSASFDAAVQKIRDSADILDREKIKVYKNQNLSGYIMTEKYIRIYDRGF